MPGKRTEAGRVSGSAAMMAGGGIAAIALTLSLGEGLVSAQSTGKEPVAPTASIELAQVERAPVEQPPAATTPAQSRPPTAGEEAVLPGQLDADVPVDVDIFTGGGGTAAEMVHVPVTNLFPGDVEIRPWLVNPAADDPQSVHRGRQYFLQFNCVGCHAPNGGGGMGPALSNAVWIYGGEPANIYLSILQGRPAGMPAWGGMLPDHIIWDLVTYIQSISKKPAPPWGATVSADGFTTEQVPAEFMSTVYPWDYTTPFSYGQPPFVKPKGSPPLETPQQ